MQTENQTMKKICFLIFVLFIIASCSPNQDINGDYLRGLSYSSNGGTNSTIKNVKTVTTVDAAGDKIVATYNYTGGQLTSVTSSDNSFSYQLTYTGDDIPKFCINQSMIREKILPILRFLLTQQVSLQNQKVMLFLPEAGLLLPQLFTVMMEIR